VVVVLPHHCPMSSLFHVTAVVPCHHCCSTLSLFHLRSTPQALAHKAGGRWCIGSGWHPVVPLSLCRIPPAPLPCCALHCCSTHNPPHEQLLVGLEAGGVLSSVVCHLFVVLCCSFVIVCHLSYIVCLLSSVVCCTLFVHCHQSSIDRHPSSLPIHPASSGLQWQE
jgi:hypothetical protein